MKSYYKARAPIYDRVYSYPERQKDLRFLEKYISEQFNGLNVLEIAAGTGYWTQFIASRANSILATDAIVETLDQISIPHLNRLVQVKVVDAYSLNKISGDYNGFFAGLWISHVPRQRLHEFLLGLHELTPSGAIVLFIDNSSVQCKRLPVTHTDTQGNTYQDRELDDGSLHRVLKNFPTENELMDATKEFAINQKYLGLENFWLFQYVAR